MLSFGGPATFEPSAWEWAFQAAPLMRTEPDGPGDPGGRLAAWPESGSLHYNRRRAWRQARATECGRCTAWPERSSSARRRPMRRRTRTRHSGASRPRARAQRSSLRLPSAASAPGRQARDPARQPASASRRPPSARSPRSPCSAAKSASACIRRARRRRAARSSAVGARPGRRPARRSRRRGERGDRDDLGVARRRATAAPPGGRPPPATAGPTEVGLRHHEHVGHLHDSRLQELEHVARARLDDHRDGVGDVGHLGLRLTDADGLDHDHIEGGGQGGGGRPGRRERARPAARRRPSSG